MFIRKKEYEKILARLKTLETIAAETLRTQTYHRERIMKIEGIKPSSTEYMEFSDKQRKLKNQLGNWVRL